jgi:SpoVK/Ycf46/Vps4 family AAA+-type ATPase
MATADQIKALITSHAEGDDARFYAVAMQVAAAEARRGKQSLAVELRDLIDSARHRAHSRELASKITPIARPTGDLANLVVAEQPDVRIADMVLQPDLEKKIGRILTEQRKVAKLSAMDLTPRRKLLFAGPSGCGKTMTAAVLAGELGIPLLTVSLEAVITKFLGETGSKMRLIFQAMSESRAVFLFDEFDSIGFQRGGTTDVGEARRIVNTFLASIENVQGTSLVICATNHPDVLDSALFRRFDDLLRYSLPDRSLIRRLVSQRLFERRLRDADIDIDEVELLATGMNFSEIVSACDDALKEALLNDRSINQEDIVTALKERRAFRFADEQNS